MMKKCVVWFYFSDSDFFFFFAFECWNVAMECFLKGSQHFIDLSELGGDQIKSNNFR